MSAITGPKISSCAIDMSSYMSIFLLRKFSLLFYFFVHGQEKLYLLFTLSIDLYVREDGGLNVVPLVTAGLPSGDQRGAFALSDIDVLENLLVLVFVNLHAVSQLVVACIKCCVFFSEHESLTFIPVGLG